MRTIWDIVQQRAKYAPAAPAAVGERQTYDYQELLERAADLASRIRRHARAGELVAIDVDGPVSGAVCLLAATKAGCPVLPLNKESPPAHQARVWEDARPALVVGAEDECDFMLTPTGGECPTVLRNVAYVMYTSGSTGQPKGVVVSQEALVARLQAMAQVPGLSKGESMVAMTALSFDISLAEMFVPLAVGGAIIAADPSVRMDPETFSSFVKKHEPDVIQATPSFWRLVLAGGWGGAPGSRIWCGGEPLTSPLAAQLLDRSAQLWNLYGPTEATIWASAFRVQQADRIRLGRPLPGSGMCLDTWTDRSTDTGEVLLYGQGLAQEYLADPELTDLRFHMFDTPDGQRRVYRTGDRARQDSDDVLEFLGRSDSQIKLRGHRIELGEVESVLEEHPLISEAMTVIRQHDRPERAYLAAYLVMAGGFEERELRAWISERLPASHQPSRLIMVDALPRTVAGKVDRVRLTQGNE
ncbi:AMP-binding protein [Streptomyces hirsutus]|uniref:AMP-binding protein n=1 Tax=Streptomyces hirsutus TaxID=35620 RepID=UPI0036773BBA